MNIWDIFDIIIYIRISRSTYSGWGWFLAEFSSWFSTTGRVRIDKSGTVSFVKEFCCMFEKLQRLDVFWCDITTLLGTLVVISISKRIVWIKEMNDWKIIVSTSVKAKTLNGCGLRALLAFFNYLLAWWRRRKQVTSARRLCIREQNWQYMVRFTYF